MCTQSCDGPGNKLQSLRLSYSPTTSWLCNFHMFLDVCLVVRYVMRSLRHEGFPTLADILSDTAPHPWTLDKFVEYLTARHCVETLEFINYASIYHECYERVTHTTSNPSRPLTPGYEHLRSLWTCLLETYIAPNSKREVNLPYDIKTRLLATQQSEIPPSPLMLDSAVGVVYDLMEGPMMVSFLNSSIRSKPLETGAAERRPRRESGWRLRWSDIKKLRFRW